MRFNFKLKSTEGEHTLTVDGNSGNVIISGMGGFEDAGRLLWHTLRDGEAMRVNLGWVMRSLHDRIADRQQASRLAAQALNPVAAGTMDNEVAYLKRLVDSVDDLPMRCTSSDLQGARLAMAICYCAATMRHCDAVDTIAEQRKRFEDYSKTMEAQLSVADAEMAWLRKEHMVSYQHLEANRDDLAEELMAARIESAELARGVEEARTECKRFEEELAEVRAERDKAESANRKLFKRLKEAEVDNRELHKRIGTLEDQLVLEHAKIREMKKELAEMECSAERDAMETDGLREMLNDECREHKETQGTLEAVASHVERQGRIIDVLLGVIDG